MADKLLEPLQKSLVVGLGGTGKKVLLQLKRRLLDTGYLDSARQPDLRLICLDFDPAEEKVHRRVDHGATVRLAPDEVCWLDGGLIHTRLHNMQQEYNQAYYREWYPDREGSVIQMGAHRAGAAQWRPLGRIGYFEHVDRIQVVLRRALNRLLEVRPGMSTKDGDRGVVVYLVCSLAGGTGGGTFLDVAYFLRSLPVDLQVVGLFLLPGIYAEYDISGRLFANTYASLKELAMFANQRARFCVRYPNGRRIDVPRLGQPPFDAIYLYDNLLLRSQLESNTEQMAAVMAETVYFDLAETRLGEMYHSATTNAASLSGNREDNDITRKSVFAAAGSLTMLLPSWDELRDFWGRQYVAERLVPALEAGQALAKEAARREPPREAQHRAEFASLDRYIDQSVSDTLVKVRDWPQGYIANVSGEMAGWLEGCRHSPDAAAADLNSWLHQLAEPPANGVFNVKPRRLPDINSSYGQPLVMAADELSDYLRQRVEQALDRDQGSGGGSAENLYAFLRSKALMLRGQVRHDKARLRSLVDDNDGVFQKIIASLMDIYAAKPWAGSMTNQACAHWARRFLAQAAQQYRERAARIRVHTIMAGVLAKVTGDKLVDRDLEESVAGAAAAVRAISAGQVESMKCEDKEQGTLTVRTLADDAFWANAWQTLRERLPQDEGLVGFMVYLRQRLGTDEAAAGLPPEQVARLAVEYGGEVVLRAMGEEDQEVLDLHELVDPELRKRELGRARHNYMVGSTIIKNMENNRAYASAPAYSRRSSRTDNGDLYEALRGDMGNVLSATPAELDTYNPREALEPGEPGKIVVRHLTLNFTPANLRSIGDYYHAYSRYGQARKLFHVDVNFTGFPEIIDESQEIPLVTCGNPGCTEDITDLPREVIDCPNCNRPIRSRCGNPDCPENELHLHEAMNKKPGPYGLRPDPDKSCPVCGGYARTYWWHCDEHNLDIRTTSHYCPKCLKEYQAELDHSADKSGTGQHANSFTRVRRREGVKPYTECPGCRHDCLPEPTRIEFLDVYDQVPDGRLDRAWQVYEGKETRHGHCAQCGAQLLPFCPYGNPAEDAAPHFAQRQNDNKSCQRDAEDRPLPQDPTKRGEGFFICTTEQEHAARKIYECSYCHLPLKEGATYCPRCKRTRMERQDDHEQGEGPLGPEDKARLQRDLRDVHQSDRKAITSYYQDRVGSHRWLPFGLSREGIAEIGLELERVGRSESTPPDPDDCRKAFEQGMEDG